MGVFIGTSARSVTYASESIRDEQAAVENSRPEGQFLNIHPVTSEPSMLSQLVILNFAYFSGIPAREQVDGTRIEGSLE